MVTLLTGLIFPLSDYFRIRAIQLKWLRVVVLSSRGSCRDSTPNVKEGAIF